MSWFSYILYFIEPPFSSYDLTRGSNALHKLNTSMSLCPGSLSSACWYPYTVKGLFSVSILTTHAFYFFWQIVRLLANHPYFQITLMTADRKAGQSIGSVFPHLVTQVKASIFIWPVLLFQYLYIIIIIFGIS